MSNYASIVRISDMSGKLSENVDKQTNQNPVYIKFIATICKLVFTMIKRYTVKKWSSTTISDAW